MKRPTFERPRPEPIPGRERCGRLGKGKPGRKVREAWWESGVLRAPHVAKGIKVWARTTDDGKAWLQRKRAS